MSAQGCSPKQRSAANYLGERKKFSSSLKGLSKVQHYVPVAFRGFRAPCLFNQRPHALFARSGIAGARACISRGDLEATRMRSRSTGGVEDHVHLLCRLGRTISQSDWIKELKRSSSLWLKEQAPALHTFQWQGGYAVFAVSVSNIDAVKEYIARQPEHHRNTSFQDELRLLLRKHRVEWDEKYLWD